MACCYCKYWYAGRILRFGWLEYKDSGECQIDSKNKKTDGNYCCARMVVYNPFQVREVVERYRLRECILDKEKSNRKKYERLLKERNAQVRKLREELKTLK